MPLPDPSYAPDLYADLPLKRLIAFGIDVAITILISVGIVVLTVFIGLIFWPLLLASVGFVYRWVTLARGSATWGMAFVGMELRHLDGARLDPLSAALHTLGFTLSFAIFPLQIVSIGLMLIGPSKQGLTDYLLGIAPINARARA